MRRRRAISRRSQTTRQEARAHEPRRESSPEGGELRFLVPACNALGASMAPRSRPQVWIYDFRIAADSPDTAIPALLRTLPMGRNGRRNALPNTAALAIIFGFALICAAQTPKEAADQWRAAHEEQILQEFTALLSIPNVASDKTDIQRNADVLTTLLEKRHVAAKQLTASGANPVVYGEIKTPGAKHTIVFYAHYDGQPVNPDDWESRAPFTPMTKMVKGEPRIYARSASDDKAAIVAQLTALDALQAAHIPVKANVRFVWEGEEEAGSTNLGAVLEKYRDELGGDVGLICDGPVDQSGRQTVVFGARGVTHLAITLYGPKRELHSGHYGNWAPNPAMMLAQLLGGMEDTN